MGILDLVRELLVHCVGRRAKGRRTLVTALAGAAVSSLTLLGSCIEQGPLFADRDLSSAADGGGEAVPFDPQSTGLAGTVATSEPGDAAPVISESSDSGLLPPDGAALAGEACRACLSSECPETIQTCRSTPGCEAISACAQDTACVEDECFCGTVNRLMCAAGGGNGPCRDVTLAAPGAHEPTPAVPNAGPAAEAARSVGNCRRASGSCRDVCAAFRLQ